MKMPKIFKKFDLHFRNEKKEASGMSGKIKRKGKKNMLGLQKIQQFKATRARDISEKHILKN